MGSAARLAGAFAVAIGIWFALPALAAAASLTPTTLAFGDVGLGTAKTLPIAVTLDPGYSLASFSSADGAFSAPWSLDTSGCSSTSDADCSFHMTFTASTLGAKTAHFDAFECPIAGGSCRNIATETLTATGISTASLTPATLAFGDVGLGTAKTLPIAVTLDPGYSLASFSSADGAFSAPWTLDTSGCSSTSDADCSFHMTFTASTLGAKTAHLDALECPIAGGSCRNIGTETLTATGVQSATTTTLASSSKPSRVNQAATLTATVTQASGSAPTGSVTFTDGATTLATVTTSGGVASLTTSTLTAGTHTITATYNGDGTHAGSSATVTQVVQDASTLLAVLQGHVTGVGPGTSLA